MNDIKTLKSIIDPVPRFRMSVLSTPIQRMEQLSKDFGINLYCKRDDLTGFAFGGNKIRKLDYLIPDAIKKGSDSIVTWGANQSNWCRMTSVAGSVNNLDVHLVLKGAEPDKPTANLLLDRLAGAYITHVDTEDDTEIEQACHDKCKELQGLGKNPYYISVGGSNDIGTIGYARAFCEVLEFTQESGTRFLKIIVASGSAGTQAGLVVGQLLSGWIGDIIGMTVSRSSGEQEEKVFCLVMETLALLKITVNKSRISKAIKSDDSYLGEGYRENTPECEEAIRIFTRREGLFLDEVYTGKAAAGLIDYARKGLFGTDENILFFHTGGNVQLFE